MKVLVTGGAGFIGSNVVKALVQEGHAVRVLHLPRENLANLSGFDVEKLSGDITDPTSLTKAMKGCELVFHMAAIYALWLPDASLMRKVNVEGTRNVLSAAKRAGVRRVVYTSTAGCFGGQPRGIRATEASPCALAKTGDAYILTKYEAHKLALQAAADGQDVVLVGPTGPIGPGDIGPTPTGRLLITVATLPALAVPAAINNMVDVRDVARGHLLAAEKGVSGETYLLGNRDLSGAEMAGIVHELLGVRRPVVTIPRLLEGVASQLAGHAALWVTEHVTNKPPLVTPTAAKIGSLGTSCDCSKAVRELGLPQTPVEIAIRDALAWFARHGYIKPTGIARRLRTVAADAGV